MDISVISLIIFGEVITIVVAARVFHIIYKRKLAAGLTQLKNVLAKNTSKSRLIQEQVNPKGGAGEKGGGKLYPDYIQDELVKIQAKYHMVQSEKNMTLSFSEPKETRLLSLRYHALKTERQSLLPGTDSDLPWAKLDEILKKHAKVYFRDNNAQSASPVTSSAEMKASGNTTPRLSPPGGSTALSRNKKSDKLFDGYASKRSEKSNAKGFDGYEKQAGSKKNNNRTNQDKVSVKKKLSMEDNKSRKNELFNQLGNLSDQSSDSDKFVTIISEIKSLDDCIYNVVNNAEYEIKEVYIDYQPKNEDAHNKHINEIKEICDTVVEKHVEIASVKEGIEELEEPDALKDCMSLLDEQIKNYKNQIVKTDAYIDMLKSELGRCQSDLTRFKRLSSTARIENLERALKLKDNEIDSLKDELLGFQGDAN